MKKAFRLISFLEGISYLLLLFVAVPIKYFQGDESYVKMLGMPHGILFIGYIVLAIIIQKKMKWNLKNLGIVSLASIVPFGTFYIDKKYFRTT
jgi:integral membrane protein|tara:strand:- start:5153 stop:5431 length:279 start_codon:yes stop_codon:yes gene_type:complete